MANPIIAVLLLMWRLRLVLAVIFLIMLGHIWIEDAKRSWDAWHQPAPEQAYCDNEHKIPFIPADRCGGVTSCDRLAAAAFGVSPACPK